MPHACTEDQLVAQPATGEHAPPACQFRRPAEILPTPELPERPASRRTVHAGRVCSPELNRSVGARWNDRPTFCASLRLFAANPCIPCNPWSGLSGFCVLGVARRAAVLCPATKHPKPWKGERNQPPSKPKKSIIEVRGTAITAAVDELTRDRSAMSLEADIAT